MSRGSVQRADKIPRREVDIDHDSLRHQDRQVDDVRMIGVGEQGDGTAGARQPGCSHQLVEVAHDVSVWTRGVRSQPCERLPVQPA